MYDPCVCHYGSKMRIQLKLFSTAEITMTSNTTGTLAPDETTLSTASGTYDDNEGQHTWGWKDIAGFNEKAVQKSIKAYKDLSDFTDGLNFAVDKSGLSGAEKQGNKSAVASLKNALASSDFLKAGLKALPYVSSAITFLDFFVGGGEEDPGPQEVKLTPMAIEFNSRYKGTITNSILKKEITFSTPGGTNINPTSLDYPLYNEPMGVFHLFKTPVLTYKTTYTSSPSLSPTTYGPVYQVDPNIDPTWLSWDPYLPHALLDPSEFYAVDPFLHQPFGIANNDPVRSYVYKLDQDLEYLVNEATEFTDGSEVYAAIFVEVSAGSGPGGIGYLRGTNFNMQTEGKGFYHTRFMPLSCMNGLTAEFTTSDYNSVKVYLKVIANFERGDAYVIPNETQNVMWSGNFAVNKVLGSGSYNFNSSFINVPKERAITQSAVLTQNITAYDRITIYPGVSLSSLVPIKITASEEIIVSPGVTLSPNITLEIAQPNGCGSFYSPKPKDATLTSFCTSTVYNNTNRQLRLPAPGEEEEEFHEKSSITKFSLIAHPNPFTHELTLEFTLPAAGITSARLLDPMGREVLRLWEGKESEAGPQEQTFDLSSLSSGIYLAVLETPQGRQTVRVVKN